MLSCRTVTVCLMSGTDNTHGDKMRRMCRECKKRPALFYDKRWKAVRADNDHDLCWRCYRAVLNRARWKPEPTTTVEEPDVTIRTDSTSAIGTNAGTPQTSVANPRRE